MYKLVAIDLDGTLLDSYGQISEKNKTTIQNAISKGTKIVLTSGRGTMSVKNFASELGADEYLTEDVYQYILNRKENDYTKITVCDDNNIIFNSIIRKLRTINGIDVLDVGHMTRKLLKFGTEVYSIEYFYTEITNENTDKWNAIKFLTNELGISKDEVMAIGDNVNDQTMLENAGMGVAMANSAPYIQKMGKVVTDTNNNDGVAKAIEKYILSE